MSTLLEKAWEHREETLYKSVFGDLGPGIYPLTIEIFSDAFKASCDPRWLSIGVFECPPHGERKTWTYVSSGLSNPWEEDEPPADPEEPSGLGVEYVFNTTARAIWAIKLVQHVVAYELLVSSDKIAGRDAIYLGDRIPVQILDAQERPSAIQMVMVAEPCFVPADHDLPSGTLQLVQLVGITEREAAFCRANKAEALIDKLRSAGCYDVTDPWRASLEI